MRSLIAAFGIGAALSMGGGVAQANIVYAVNTTITSANPTGNPLQTNTILGSITTDGTIGVLPTASILDYTLSLVDQLNAANNFILTPTTSTIVLNTGSALSASASALSFDFSGTGEFLIQANSPGPFSGSRYFCFSTGVFACLPGVTVSPGFIFSGGTVLTGTDAPVGVTTIGLPPEPPIGVPEPGALWLLGIGLAGMAAFRSSARQPTAIA